MLYMQSFHSYCCTTKLFHNLFAPGGNDYQQPIGPLSFTFLRIHDSFDIRIPLVDDNTHEPIEEFYASLSTTGDQVLNPGSCTIRIIDDDDGTYIHTHWGENMYNSYNHGAWRRGGELAVSGLIQNIIPILKLH